MMKSLRWYLPALFLLAAGFNAEAATPPNIVFILIDDLRHDTFGFMDHPYVETPHIDRLAETGTRFSEAFVTTSLCSPARASFLTGQYMHHHHVVDNQDRMPSGTVTFPQLLQQSGYQTAFLGKWHMGGTSAEPRPGFSHWVSFRGQGTYLPRQQTLNVNGDELPRRKYMTDELTDYAVDWLKTQDHKQPFLMYLSHKGVHGFYKPAERHRGRYHDQPFEPPATMLLSDETRQNTPLWVQDQRNSWHGVEHPYHGRSQESVPEMYRHYCEMILSIDDSVGQVMQTLEQQGLAENTLVVFTSDGGHLWGEHGLIDKRCAYEESIRIPLLARWPGHVPAGRVCSDLITNIDMAPTLLSAAGVSIPESMDGRSMLSVLTGDDNQQPRSLLYEYYWEPSFPQTPTTFALRGERYKLIQYHGLWDSDELYDLQQDPQETRNLIHMAEHRQTVAALRRQLYQRLKETDGLRIPLGFKHNHGASERRADGSRRARFPARIFKTTEPPE